MKLFLASSNPHKASEFEVLLKGSGLEIKSAPEKLDVVEDGTTFQANAKIKAKAYFDKFATAALADDSGLVIESLPDILGVQSARFAPELPDYKDKCLKILDLLKDKDWADRKAYFSCFLCFYLNDELIFQFEGRVQGYIGHELKGEDGFGYDPIFIPEKLFDEKKTLAQVFEWKNINGHRAKACEQAKAFFSQKELPSLLK